MTSNQPPYGDPQWPTSTGSASYSETIPTGGGDPVAIETDPQASFETSSTKEQAAEQATEVKDHAMEAGRDVAGTAKAEAASVAQDVRTEIRGLFDSSMSEVRGQAGAGQSRLASGLRGLTDELGDLAQGQATEQGMATRAVQELASYGDNVAGWLENREPADVLDEVRRFAARRPVAFLAIAAGAGLLVGRFARGLQADRSESDSRNEYRGQTVVQDYYEQPLAGAPREQAWDTTGAAAADPGYPGQGFSGQYGDNQFGAPGVQR